MYYSILGLYGDNAHEARTTILPSAIEAVTAAILLAAKSVESNLRNLDCQALLSKSGIMKYRSMI